MNEEADGAGATRRYLALYQHHPWISLELDRVRTILTDADPGGPSPRLQRLRDVHMRISQALSDVVVCRPGCANCCYGPVVIDEGDAYRIAERTGVPYRKTSARRFPQAIEDAGRFIGTPCPFLDASRHCSIYESRPAVCALHHSLMDSAEACAIGSGQRSRAALNTSSLDLAYINAAIEAGYGFADVRDFFETP